MGSDFLSPVRNGKRYVACSSSHNPLYIQKAARDWRTIRETEISCPINQRSKQKSWKSEGLLKTCMWFSVTAAGKHAPILKQMSYLFLELVIQQVNFWEGAHPKVATQTPQQRAKLNLFSVFNSLLSVQSKKMKIQAVINKSH